MTTAAVLSFTPPGAPPEPGGVPTLADLLDAYERDCFPKLAPGTQYQNTHLFRRFRHEMGHMALVDLTPAYLQAWCHQMLKHYAPGTVRRRLYAFSALLTVAVRYYDWLPVNPMFRVIYPAETPGRVRFLSEQELAKLLSACRASQQRHLYPVVLVATTTGARKNEILGLTWRDVDLERGLLTFHVTKNKQRRVVPIRGAGLELLRRSGWHHRPDAWVFPRADGLKPILIEDAWRTARKRAKIDNLHFHDLRHTAASYLAMSGASLLEIAEILGHKNIRQTAKYAHLTLSHTGSVVERMVQQRLGSEALYV